MLTKCKYFITENRMLETKTRKNLFEAFVFVGILYTVENEDEHRIMHFLRSNTEINTIVIHTPQGHNLCKAMLAYPREAVTSLLSFNDSKILRNPARIKLRSFHPLPQARLYRYSIHTADTKLNKI